MLLARGTVDGVVEVYAYSAGLLPCILHRDCRVLLCTSTSRLGVFSATIGSLLLVFFCLFYPPSYNLTVVRAIEGEGISSPSAPYDGDGDSGEVPGPKDKDGVAEAKLEEGGGKNGKAQVQPRTID